MQKRIVALLLSLILSISLIPEAAHAVTDYSTWNGCWVVKDFHGNEPVFEYVYYFDFGSLKMNLYSISDESAENGWTMTKVNDKTFTYKPTSVEYTVILNDDGTITQTAMATAYLAATNELLAKDDSYLSKFFKSVPTSGLGSFVAVNSYNGTFSDVAQGSWYESSVKCVYEYGVMNGTGNGLFNPDGNVSMAEVITVASRIHSHYNNKNIPDLSDATWYGKYYQYAKDNSMLPANIDTNTNLLQPATRAFMAYVLLNSIGNADLAAINTSAIIADLDSIDANYKSAIKKMYESGIITGTDGNKFNPNKQASRADMSVIITRLLVPSERVSSDSKIDSTLLAQESNVMNHMPYYIGDKGRSVAVCAPNAYNLIMYGDDIFFNQHVGAGSTHYDELIKYNPTKQTKISLFKTTSNSDLIESFTIYDGIIYLIADGVDTSKPVNSSYDDNYYRIYSVTTDGKVNKMVEQSGGLGEKIAVFNNTIYYNSFSKLYSYKIDGNERPKKLATNISDWVMSGNTIYYVDYAYHVCKIAANYPDIINTICNVETRYDTKVYGKCINFSNGNLYVIDNYSNLYKLENNKLKFLSSTLPHGYTLGVYGDYFCYHAIESAISNFDYYLAPFSSPSNVVSLFDSISKNTDIVTS